MHVLKSIIYEMYKHEWYNFLYVMVCVYWKIVPCIYTVREHEMGKKEILNIDMIVFHNDVTLIVITYFYNYDSIREVLLLVH